MEEFSSSGTQSQDTALTPEGHKAFTLPAKPDLPSCPVCKTGLLYTIAYDTKALHEKDQAGPTGDAAGHDHYVPSGGSIRLMCFNCGQPQTQALNPKAKV